MWIYAICAWEIGKLSIQGLCDKKAHTQIFLSVKDVIEGLSLCYMSSKMCERWIEIHTQTLSICLYAFEEKLL